MSAPTVPPGDQTAAGGVPAQALFPEAYERRRRRRRAGAAAALVAAMALAVAAVIWPPWGGSTGTGPSGAGGALLAGRSPGPVGQATFTWRVTVAHQPRASGTEHLTLSGQDRALSFTRTDYPTGPYLGGTNSGAERIVGGQHYLLSRIHGQRAWIRENLPGYAEPKVIDPRILLPLLRARTPLRPSGTQVIGGVRLTVLTATDPFGLTRRDLLPVIWTSAEPVASLRVWADSRGVVHRMTYSFRYWPASILPTTPVSRAAVRRWHQSERAVHQAFLRSARYKERTGKQAPRRWVRLATLREQLFLTMAYPPAHGAEITETTVIYSGIGQPQQITAPPHPVTSG